VSHLLHPLEGRRLLPPQEIAIALLKALAGHLRAGMPPLPEVPSRQLLARGSFNKATYSRSIHPFLYIRPHRLLLNN
jgi:hypothetical protein